jgi:hypothetical protein
MAEGQGSHRWTFHRVGGLDQVSLEDGEDLAHLEELDPKLWVALACPTRGLEIDARTLELLDRDGDGRVRVPEVLEAVRFCRARLRDLGLLVRPGDAVPLAALRDDTPEGRASGAAARQVLRSLGQEKAEAVSLADVARSSKIWEGTAFNGDGVVPPEAASDEATRRVIAEALACCGSVPDRGGRPGLNRALLDAFWKALEAHAAWWKEAGAPGVMPLGEATPAAFEALRAVRSRAEDFFARCALAAMDPRAGAAMNRSDADLLALAARDLSAAPELDTFPLARVEVGRELPLEGGVNPAWAGRLARLRREVVAPLLGAEKASLSATEWNDLLARFAAHEAWLGKKGGAEVERLGRERVAAILAGGREPVAALLARDEACEAEVRAEADVERLVRYRRDLHRLLRNFVSFADFYDASATAIFQVGRLYVDGRSCELCVRVDDPAAHAPLAAMSRMYLAYCDCRRPGGESMKVAACVTQGDGDYLAAGRNGVFFDRSGRDWDATVVRVVDNPISLRQAFWAPYTKFGRFVESQVARFAAAKEKGADERVAGAAATTTAVVTGTAAPPPSPVDVGKMVGIVAALGVGVGALGTLLGGFVSGFFSLQPWWAKLVAVAGAMLVISGPYTLVAWLKLRQRTLGPVLDANGWAVNGRVRVNIPLGTALTERATLPPGSRRSLEDPYEDRGARRRRRLLWLVLILLLAALAAARQRGIWPFERAP